MAKKAAVSPFLERSKARSPSLDDLAGEFDELLARMQSPKAKKAATAAFAASPAELGRAAVKAARMRKARKRASGG